MRPIASKLFVTGVIVSLLSTLVGCQGTLCHEERYKPNPTNWEPNDSNMTKSEPRDPNMTKWGPKLSEGELAAIAKLSTPELVAMLKTGDALHAYAALRQLKADGGWKKNFDLLLSIAAETRGSMIVEGLIRSTKKSATAEDKRIVDKFLDFLEAQLKKHKPSVSRLQAVRSLAKTVHVAFRGAWWPYSPSGPPDPNKVKVPYAHARVLSILTRCLNSEDWEVRSEAIGWLGNVGANDLNKADDIVVLLNAQFAKEDAREEKETIKAKRKEHIKDSLRRLNQDIDYLRNGLPEMHELLYRLGPAQDSNEPIIE